MTRYLLNIFRICPTYSAIFIHVWDLTWDEKKRTYHIPYSQNNGACSYMAAEAAARRVPPVPRRNHLFVHTLNFRLFHECRRKQLTSQGYDNRKKVGKITSSLLGPPPHPASVWGDVSASGKHRNREPLIWLTRSHVTTGGFFFFLAGMQTLHNHEMFQQLFVCPVLSSTTHIA